MAKELTSLVVQDLHQPLKCSITVLKTTPLETRGEALLASRKEWADQPPDIPCNRNWKALRTTRKVYWMQSTTTGSTLPTLSI